MDMPHRTAGHAVITEQGPIFDLTLEIPGTEFSEAVHSAGQTTIRVRDAGRIKHVSVEDAEHPLRIDWLTFMNGLPDGKSVIKAPLPAGWDCEYKWNHIVTYKDRCGPHASIATLVSRNCWIRPGITPGGFDCRLAQLEPGACHVAWITGPGGPFPVKSFKDVGSGEPGGIKFRVGDLDYILFHLEDVVLDTPGTSVTMDKGVALLRYVRGVLNDFWRVTESGITAW